MKNEFIRIDLHIHTPESSCYNGTKDNATYLDILRAAKAKNLSIIAISDHNSIEGYVRLLEIKEVLLKQMATLSASTDPIQTKKTLDKVKKDLSLFEGIKILPGVEFEVKNNVHMLVIFDDIYPIGKIRKFLFDGGYDDRSFGRESTSVVANWDVLELYEEAKKCDCIVIDAHTDSDKGLWKTISKGGFRARSFRSDQLCAVCYKN